MKINGQKLFRKKIPPPRFTLPLPLFNPQKHNNQMIFEKKIRPSNPLLPSKSPLVPPCSTPSTPYVT